MTTVISRSLPGPYGCPSCGAPSDQLVVATKEITGMPRFMSDGRGSVEFVGYDCQKCGEKLRFSPFK